MIIIGGHDEYRDKDEEEQVVISRWARRKVVSQFDEEYLDGSRSFIFSWNETHREIHEEALKHYLDPSKKEQKFQLCQNQEQKQNQHKTRSGLCFFSTYFKSTMLLSWGMEVIGKIWEQVF